MVPSPTQAVEAALRERVKELTCLYEISELAARPGSPLEAILVGIAELVRRAWQYPEITSARIVLDGRSHETSGFREGQQRQAAEVVTVGVPRGFVEVVYADAKPELDEGPFLKEERRLIDTVAAQVAAIVRRREVAQERLDLQNQLRHAEHVPAVAVAGGFSFEDQIMKGLALGAPYVKLVGMARAPIAAAMVGKTIGRAIAAREVPVYVQRFGESLDEIFITAGGLRQELGDAAYERLPAGAIGLYTYYERLAQGLRQLMAGTRKFSLEYLSRDDLAALTREAARVSGIQSVMDVDQGLVERIFES